MTSKDFTNWNSVGTAVLLKDKAVITPEMPHMKGLIHTTKPLDQEYVEAWEAYLDIEVGNSQNENIGFGGMGLYYIRNVEQEYNGIFGYSAKFDGAAVTIN